MRTKGEKIRKLENLAKACAEAKDDGMKKMWYDKLIELGKQYNMSDYVIRMDVSKINENPLNSMIYG